jgi:hypothetical protein
VLAGLRAAVAPLPRLNPIAPVFGGLGRGTGTLAASFGVRLDERLGNTPTGSRPLDEVLAEDMPDPERSGVMPEVRETIEAVQALTPDWLGIALPDMQGPFNLAHMILGDEVFVAPLTEPEKFRRLMARVTDFFIAAHRALRQWIRPARFPSYPRRCCNLCECSVNMISREMYVEHVLPHDRRIAEYFGRVSIHPCSGPHVFHVTLDHLPNVVHHEAGWIAKTFAGSIGVEEALAAIGGRPIILAVGQELPRDFAEAERVVQRLFRLARQHPRMTFGFTGMFWKQADEPRVLDLHRRLDAFWEREVFGGPHAPPDGGPVPTPP